MKSAPRAELILCLGETETKTPLEIEVANLEKLADDSYTVLFTYNSMVHYEVMDAYEYLKYIYRVLRKGGKMLFYYSNYSIDYMADFAHMPHARCFMSEDIFAHLANRGGFKIIKQEVIDWYG